MATAVFPNVFQFRAYTQAGSLVPLAGGYLYFYAAGTTTPQAAYTDTSGTVPLPNPLQLDANGSATFCLLATKNYKINLTDSLGVVQNGYPIDNIVPDDALNQLASTSAGQGANLIGYLAPYTGAMGTTQQQINNEMVSVFRWFTPAQIADVTSGAGTIDVTAALQAALTNGNSLFMPDGAYLVSATLNLKSYQTLKFGANAFIKPAANGLVVFLAYSATLGLPVQRLQIEKPYIIGNGKTGVVGFKLDNVSYGTAIKNARFTDIDTGIWLYRSCYGITMYSPFALRVPSPVIVGTLSCNGNSIISPEFDNTTNMSGTGAGDAVTIQGPSGSNTISGGYIQGYAHCITDSGTNNTFDGIYFEQASDAAVYLSACSGAVVSNCNHYGQGGSSMVKARATHGCSVTNPKYTQGTGTLGLFDVDGTNSDFTAFIPAIPGINTNLGTATGIKYFTNELNAQNITTPISIFGGTAAGTGIIYDYNKLETSKIGSLLFFNFAVVWHGLTGATGDLHFTGLPFSAGSLYNLSQFSCNYSGNSLPANTAELTAGMANATTGQIQAVSDTGVLSNVPIAASGTLSVSGFIFTA